MRITIMGKTSKTEDTARQDVTLEIAGTDNDAWSILNVLKHL